MKKMENPIKTIRALIFIAMIALPFTSLAGGITAEEFY
jgi:hypothetical protein